MVCENMFTAPPHPNGYNFLGESKSRRTAKSHYRYKSYGNFAEKSEFFLLDKVVKLVGGGSVINVAYPV